jgi:hypothetical protein
MNSRKQAKVRTAGITAKEHKERKNNPEQKGLRAIQIKLHELGMRTYMVGVQNRTDSPSGCIFRSTGHKICRVSFAFFVLFCGYSISCLTFAPFREIFPFLVEASSRWLGE